MAGAAAEVTWVPSLAQSHPCVPRERGGVSGFSRTTGKQTPGLSQSWKFMFKYHIVQQHSHRAGSVVGLILQHRVPCPRNPACKPLPANPCLQTLACEPPACEPLPAILEQKPSPTPASPAHVPVPVPCTGLGHPRAPRGTQSSTNSSAEP